MLAIALAIALLGLRRQRRETGGANATTTGALGGAARVLRLELGFHVAAERAADRLFATALDALVTNLERGGLRVGHVAQEARAAVLGVPGLDDERLRAAIATLPLEAGAIAHGSGKPGAGASLVRVELLEARAAPAEDAALQQAAAVVRARLAALGLEPGRDALVTLDAPAHDLVVRLPLLDDRDQGRVKALLEAPGVLTLHALAVGRGLADAFAAGDLPVGDGKPAALTRDPPGYEVMRVPGGAPLRALLDRLRPPLVPGDSIAATDEDAGGVTVRVVRRESLSRAGEWRFAAGETPRVRLDPQAAARVRAQLPNERFVVLLDGRLASAPLLPAELETPIGLTATLPEPPSGRAADKATSAPWSRRTIRILVESGPLPVPLVPSSQRLVPAAR